MFKRLVKHLVTTKRQVKQHFPTASLASIKAMIAGSETLHMGEIRLVIESALEPIDIVRGITPRERALDLFAQLRVWDTEFNSGVLIYVLFADHAVEIVADRGINSKTGGTQQWQAIVTDMQIAFAGGQFAAGTQAGITAVTAELVKFFPPNGFNTEELINDVTLL